MGFFCFEIDYMGAHPTSFERFWTMFVSSYVSLFYPEACKSAGLIDAFTESGFHNKCPPGIQSVLISKLNKWASDEKLVNFLWGTKGIEKEIKKNKEKEKEREEKRKRKRKSSTLFLPC